MIIFLAFAITRELFSPATAEVDVLKLAPHVIQISIQYLTVFIVVYSSVETQTEAEKTSKIISRILNDSNDHETAELNKFLTQIQTRNLKIQNTFFVLDWNLIDGTADVIAQRLDAEGVPFVF